jgi:glycosyltransferase involved in cell wall biosynthesis
MREHAPKKKRVLHLIGQLTRGGAECQLVGLATRGQSEFWEHGIVSFWSERDEGLHAELCRANVPVFYLNKRPGLDLRFLRDVRRTVREWNPDVMHTWLLSASVWGRLASPFLHRPATIVAYRRDETLSFPGARAFDRLLCRRTELAVANSERVRSRLLDHLGCDTEWVRLISNGVDTDRFKPRDPRSAARTALGLPASTRVIAMVARFAPEKNWPMFVDVACQIIRSRRDAVFVAIGHGQELDAARRLASEKGISPDRLRFLGKRDDVAQILAECDVSISTSHFEGMPNAILEAMSCALPVVATRVSGSEELIADYDTGFLVPPGDSDAMAARLEECLSDESLRRRLGQRARSFIKQRFSFERMVQEHNDAYDTALRTRFSRR